MVGTNGCTQGTKWVYKAMSETEDIQPENIGDRDEKGRFAPGNTEAYKPGASGNPKGRPKRKTLTENLLMELDKPCPQDPDGRTWREVIILATLIHAGKGKPQAMQEVWNRIDGKVKDKHELSGPDGGPIELTQERQEDYEDVLRRLAAGTKSVGEGESLDFPSADTETS